MNNNKQSMEVHNKVKSTSLLAKQAFKELHKYQQGEKTLLKTGRPYIDKHLGGALPGSLILIGAPSGVGKTHESQNILKNILDTNINKNANNYVTLEFMLEMKFLNLIMRDTHQFLHKKKSEILSKPFNEMEKKIVEGYYETLKDGRRFIVEESIDTTEFFEICDKFCEENKDKDAIIILVDHLLLVSAKNRGEDPLKTISQDTNILSKKYSNVYFIYLSQLNRGVYGDIKEKSNNMIPDVSHIYGSSHFEFLSQFAVIMFNPFKLGIEQYMSVNINRYSNLSEFYGETNLKGDRVSFSTLGNMFFHTVKVRDSDDIHDNLYIERMNISEEHLKKMKMDIEKPDNFYIEDSDFEFETDSEDTPF